MGKGRDKRKKREDPSKALKRAVKQHTKLNKGTKKPEDGEEQPEGFNNEEAIEVTLKRLEKQDKKIRTVEEVQNVPPPTPRANVVFAQHPERDTELLVFGGEFWNGEVTEAYNDLYFYHLKRNTWAKLSTSVKPAPRSSSQGIVYKHYLIIFGGEFVSQTQSQYLHFKDVWRFNSRSSEWEEMKSLKGGPPSRSGHRMVQWKRNAVVFGGFYDNAQECRYFNDLWLLSGMEGAGQWAPVKVAPGSDLPHARSGHSMGVYQDNLFLYGGYSTEKFNRFKKSEATVHHDLWMIKLEQPNTTAQPGEDTALPVWQKIRLGGVPPPIRCGVSSATKDRRMYLFGGVVDIESPGGKMVSTFNNDLFVFHMDSRRFFPVVLRKAAAKAVTQKRKDDLNDLEAQLNALKREKKKKGKGDEGSSSSSEDAEEGDDDEDDEDSELDLDDGGDAASVAAKEGESQLMKESYETNRFGQTYPHRRMDASLIVAGNQLYIFGGQFESGKKEITMVDLFSLNLNKLDSYAVLQSQDLSAAVWMGKDSEGDANSWESGSTVVSNAFDLYMDGEDDEDGLEGEEADDDGVDFALMPRQHLLDPTDDTDEAPQAIPAELDVDVTPGQGEIDFLTRVRGKKGLQVHKAQLLAQLGASAAVPTPEKEETFQAFFERTDAFWETTAKESIEGKASAKRVRKEAAEFARRRYHEARELLSQLTLVEEREREEAKFFQERRLQKDKEWDEYEKEQQGLRKAEAGNVAAALRAGANAVDDDDEYDEDDEDDASSTQDE